MLNRLSRAKGRDELSLILPSLDVENDREVIKQIIQDYISSLDTNLIEKSIRDRVLVSQGLHLELNYLGYLLIQEINPKISWDLDNFLDRLRDLDQKLSVTKESYLLPNVLSNEHASIMINYRANLVDSNNLLSLLQVRIWDNILDKWVNLEVTPKLGILTSKREYLKLLLSQGRDIYGMSLPELSVIDF